MAIRFRQFRAPYSLDINGFTDTIRIRNVLVNRTSLAAKSKGQQGLKTMGGGKKGRKTTTTTKKKDRKKGK